MKLPWAAVIGMAILAIGAGGMPSIAQVSPIEEPLPEPAHQVAKVPTVETVPLPAQSGPLPLRSSVSADGPMDIGIAKDESEADQAPAEAAADRDVKIGEDEAGAVTLDETPDTQDGAGNEAPDAPETEQDESGVDAEVANEPFLPGFPEAREELRPSGAVAVLRGLDKITARITIVEAEIGEPIRFGKLEVLASYCYKRPPEEPPEVSAFIQVKDLRQEDPEKAKIFSGWMFASSPALHAVEHPVYDVWLIDCKAERPESSFGGLSKEPTPKELDSKSP